MSNPNQTPYVPKRTNSLAADLGLYNLSTASSLTAPLDDPLALTPLRAHYLKRELVTLEFLTELSTLDSPSSLSLLGPPFLPKTRFLNGIPSAAPLPNSLEEQQERNSTEAQTDLPFLRFVFNHFILSFPFLANCPPSFFSHKLQPFVYSFVARNISSGGTAEREEDSKRKKIAGKLEKHLGLVMSAAIKLTENGGREEVVRVEDDGTAGKGAPASQIPTSTTTNEKAISNQTPIASTSSATPKVPDFAINVVAVRNVVTKGMVRNKTHEEFIVRARRRGEEDVFVARRYGDFTRLAETLRSECMDEDVSSPPTKDRRITEVRAPLNSDLSQFLESPSPTSSNFNNKNDNRMPTLSRERNRLTLRAYLRTLLSNPILANSSAFQSFLLESPISLLEAEIHDVEIREEMDRIREEEARSFKSEVEERVAELEGYLRGFREELVKSDGLSRVFATIRETNDVKDLPIEYRKVMEWARISLSSTIYQLFLGSDNSSSVFAQLKRLHGLMPYFVLRGILRISNPVAMIRGVLDLFLARPFGSTSLLQRMFSTGLAEEARELKETAELIKRKIGDEVMVKKLEGYVEAPKEIQDMYKADAAAENLDIMSVILRAGEEPALDRAGMQRVQRASVAFAEYIHERDQLSDEDDDEGPDNDDAWLFEDLHVLLKVLTKARDKDQLVELIFEGSTSELLKDLITIFYEPLAKVYKAANIADSLSDLQAFLNDLIKTVEFAEETNLSEPQKTVQLFVDLVARHEARFYHFVHQVHSKGEGLFDNLMKWIELFINFVRDGLPSPVSLEFLLPHGGQERKDVLKEVDSIIEYHRKLKAAHHVRMKKRLVKGGEGLNDNDADTAFVTGVMENLQMGNVMGDAADLAAEEEESEAEEEEYEDAASSIEDSHDSTATGGKALPPVPGGRLEPVPIKRSSNKKKDRIQIDAPKLVLVPKLVPIFVELVRGELHAARRVARSDSVVSQ